MPDTLLPTPDKAAAQRILEQTLKRLGVHKGELAVELAISPSTLSRKLGVRYPHDVFTESEIDQIAAYLDMTAAQREQLLSCYGYREAAGNQLGAGLRPAPTAVAEVGVQHSPLPASLTSLVGRTWERREVAGLLTETRLLTLTGAGGCGKTRLAQEVARETVVLYRDGVCWVELAGTAEAAFIPRVVAAALGVREAPGRPPLDTLLDWLAPRHLLLVLDNCEHLIDVCAAFTEALLSHCPSLRVLATSRERLGAAGETVWRVPPLSVPGSSFRIPGSDGSDQEPGTRNEELEEVDSVRLFVERAQSVRPTFALTVANAPAVVEVCRRLDGMPLALELAAARTNVLTVDQLAARLDDALSLLSGGRRTAPSRQQTLTGAIEWSYQLLSEPERTLLRRLAVFAGGFGLEAAEYVCNDREKGNGQRAKDRSSPLSFALLPLPSEDVLDILSHLVDKSLIVVDDRGEEARYRLLEPIRQYAHRRLADRDEPGELDATRARHAQWCLAVAEEAGRGLRGASQTEWISRVSGELDNLRAALRFCADTGNAETGLRLAAALERFWILGGRLAEGREWLSQALAQGSQVPIELRLRGLIAVAAIAQRQGDIDGSSTLAEESLGVAQETGHRQQVTVALRILGNSAHIRGDYAAAREWYEELREVAASLDDRFAMGVALSGFGLLAYAQADYPVARALFGQEIAIWRAVGKENLRELGGALNNLGMIAEAEGRYAEARTLHEESLTLKRELNDRWGIVASLANLGTIARSEGRYDEARALHEQSLAMMRELGDRRSVCHILLYLGITLWSLGDAAAAASVLEEARPLAEEVGERSTLSRVHCYLGNVARDRGDYDEAVAQYEQALAIARVVGDRQALGSALDNRGRLALLRGETAEAASALIEALAIWAEPVSRPGTADALELAAELAVATGRHEEGARLLGAGEALHAAMGSRRPAADQRAVHGALATACAALGDDAFQTAWSEGGILSLDGAAALARSTASA